MLEEKLSVPYTGVVNPTAFIADRKTKNGKIGIIGTAATISSHSYKLRLEKLNPKYKVYEQACPLFVPLVENIHLRITSSLVIFPSSMERMRSACRAMLSSWVMIKRV